MRGNPGPAPALDWRSGPISASTKEPAAGRPACAPIRDHLREHGAPPTGASSTESPWAYSQRVQRNRPGPGPVDLERGLISTSVEEPAQYPDLNPGQRPISASTEKPRAGRRPSVASGGPISANTEESCRQCSMTSMPWAYLHEPGGTSVLASAVLPALGLSPASTEEPPARAARPSPCWANLRERGETCMVESNFGEGMSLSPRRRSNRLIPVVVTVAVGPIPALTGNRDQGRGAPARLGPIPANTGEPGVMPDRYHNCEAYPRECGGTTSRRGTRRDLAGLISAGTEEPRSVGTAAAGPGAYLRRRGGTHLVWGQPSRLQGPISVLAEEPTPPRSQSRHPWAYLREREGTGARGVNHLANKGLYSAGAEELRC